jgi:hypothetical protein
MMNNHQRLKYPLTELARVSAVNLVDAWRSGKVQQNFTVTDVTNIGSTHREIAVTIGSTRDFISPRIENLIELSRFNLITMNVSLSSTGRTWEILLMQELINAVENDFAVSDYFLTTQAVGTIISSAGSITITGTVAGAASIYGNVSQTVNELAQHLRQELGDELLKHEPDLKLAIEELEVAVKQESRLSAAGKVILELGRVLQHTSNTLGAINAIGLLYNFFSA